MYAKKDVKTADRLFKMAEKMTSKIENKLHSATGQQNYTARRAKIAASMRRDGEALERIQYALYGLAEANRSGTLPGVLTKVKSQVLLKAFFYHEKWPTWEDNQQRMLKIGITPTNYLEARQALMDLTKPPDRKAERTARELEVRIQSLIRRIPGFFPTPKPIVEKMLQLADMRDGDELVLEPSAGGGAIADMIRERHPEAVLHCCERQSSLRAILKEKGHKLKGWDFFEITSSHWDYIIQNPPFEKSQDIDHVLHAYDCLAEGGRLVSVMCESAFIQQNKKASDFREWLDSVGGYDVNLPAGAFGESLTNVKTRIVVIDK